MAANTEDGRVIFLVIALIAALAFGAYDGGSGGLQRYVFPKRYWSKEVRALQDELQRYNKLAADNAVLLGQSDMKARVAVGHMLDETSCSQEVIDANRNEIEKAEREIAAIYLTNAKEMAGHLEELIRYTQGKLAEAAQELSKR